IYAHQYLDKFWGGLNTVILIFSSFTMSWAVRCAHLNQRKMLIANLIVTILCACGFLGIKGIEYEHKWHEGLLWGTHYNPVEHGEHDAEAGDGAHADAEHAAVAEHTEEVATADETQTAEPAEPADAAAGDAEGFVIEHSKIPDAQQGPEGLAHVKEGVHDFGPSPKNVQIFFGIYFAMTGLHGVHVLAGMAAISWLLFRAIRGDFNEKNYLAVDCVGLYWHVVDLVWIYLFPLLYLIH
ncbi:cytochrome c oxidase subunit 3, partial [bacterium]|nr:cytochrome c oxidase subunit 3 [bacterium]